MGIAFGVVAAVFAWREHAIPSVLAGVASGGLLLAAFAIPEKLGPVERGWMGFARAISRVTTPILMGVVYYVTLVPIGLVIRTLRKNPLSRREVDGGFWVPRPVGERKSHDLRHQF